MLTKFLCRYFSVFLHSLLVIILSMGCTSTLQQTSMVKPIVRVEIPADAEYEVRSQGTVTYTDTAEESVRISIDRMLDDAASLCHNELFDDADLLLRRIIAFINESPQQGDDTTILPVDRYMEKITFLYSEMMPDSTTYPDEIVQLLFHKQMLQSLDTLAFSGRDSLMVAGLISSNAVEYNVPVVWNRRVQKALVRYLTRNKQTIERWRERSRPYLSFMKQMFADSSLPTDLAYLPLIESGFNPKAYSRAHASGIWQFIRSTGKRYGLRSNYWLDERRDPVRSTTAAINYLKKLYNEFGHWHLALAAYNCGEGGMGRAIKKADTADYWQLRLPRETMNYVPLYLAALTIAKNTNFADSGIAARNMPAFDTVSISECIDMRDIANGIGIAPDTIRKLNPHILRWCTPPDMSDVQLYLPSGYTELFNRYLEELPDEKRVKWYRYRIRPGDNLGSIAKHFRIPMEGIRSVNRLRGTRIIAGKYLFIPIPVGNPSYAIPTIKEKPAVIPAAVASIPKNARHIVYEVKPGDTVWYLAEMFNVSSHSICSWNKLKNASIRVGQILSIYTVDKKNTTSAKTEKVTKDKIKRRESLQWYVVRRGDNPYRIARRFSMALSELCLLNDINPSKPSIYPGDTLQVYEISGQHGRKNVLGHLSDGRSGLTDGMVTYVVAAGDNLFRIAENFSISIEEIRRVNNLSSKAMIRAGDTLFIPAVEKVSRAMPSEYNRKMVYYKVKNGDNLWCIANSFGISVDQLIAMNNLRQKGLLMPGDTLRVNLEGEM